MAKLHPNRPDVTKTLLFDVESSPNIGFSWGKRDQNIIEFVKERQIISFSWKWLGEKEVYCLALPDFKGYKKDRENNTELIKRLYELFSRADVIIAHNIDNFDDKMANTDFILKGLPPPPPHKTIDTLKVARRYFRFNSNKLDDLGERLNLGRKMKHDGFSMWLGCLNADPKSWAKMKAYNKIDTVLLEKVYLKLRPWIVNHPDMNALDDHLGCPKCKSTNMHPRGWGRCRGGRRRRYQCHDCGGWATSPNTVAKKYRN